MAELFILGLLITIVSVCYMAFAVMVIIWDKLNRTTPIRYSRQKKEPSTIEMLVRIMCHYSRLFIRRIIWELNKLESLGREK